MLFTDIEGSTRLLERLGSERYGQSLDLHRRLLREAFERHGGYEVDYEGDAFFVAFARAADAVVAAAEAQQALDGAEWPDGQPIRVRMGVHTPTGIGPLEDSREHLRPGWSIAGGAPFRLRFSPLGPHSRS